MMKITAGIFKGRNIESYNDRSLRPTTSRVREAVFNLLRHGKFFKDERYIDVTGGDVLEGQRVVDIFCGTGILGLEALSRGAEHAVLIDQDARKVDLARKNAKSLGANAVVVRSDSTSLPKAHNTCTLAFLDPPYRTGLAAPALKSLAKQGWLEHGAIVVVENSKQDDFTLPEGFIALDERLYNQTKITVLQFNKS